MRWSKAFRCSQSRETTEEASLQQITHANESLDIESEVDIMYISGSQKGPPAKHKARDEDTHHEPC